MNVLQCLVMNLRNRIRRVGIKCVPWNIWRGEIRLLPISSQCLFKKKGLSIDLLEMELISEGYLFPEENLLEVIKIESNLKRKMLNHDIYSDSSIGEFPEDWEEEDFVYWINNRNEYYGEF